jgi:hypothetical protein
MLVFFSYQGCVGSEPFNKVGPEVCELLLTRYFWPKIRQ